jgi:hypothetical protein
MAHLSRQAFLSVEAVAGQLSIAKLDVTGLYKSGIVVTCMRCGQYHSDFVICACFSCLCSLSCSHSASRTYQLCILLSLRMFLFLSRPRDTSGTWVLAGIINATVQETHASSLLCYTHCHAPAHVFDIIIVTVQETYASSLLCYTYFHAPAHVFDIVTQEPRRRFAHLRKCEMEI